MLFILVVRLQLQPLNLVNLAHRPKLNYRQSVRYVETNHALAFVKPYRNATQTTTMKFHVGTQKFIEFVKQSRGLYILLLLLLLLILCVSSVSGLILARSIWGNTSLWIQKKCICYNPMGLSFMDWDILTCWIRIWSENFKIECL